MANIETNAALGRRRYVVPQTLSVNLGNIRTSTPFLRFRNLVFVVNTHNVGNIVFYIWTLWKILLSCLTIHHLWTICHEKQTKSYVAVGHTISNSRKRRAKQQKSHDMKSRISKSNSFIQVVDTIKYVYRSRTLSRIETAYFEKIPAIRGAECKLQAAGVWIK